MVKNCFSRMVACVLAVVALNVVASPVGEDTARAVAEGFLSRSSVAQRILEGRTVSSVEAQDNLWIVHLSPSGYIEIAGSTKCAPIAFFSTQNFVEPEVGSPFAAKLTGDSMMVAEKEADEFSADNTDWAKYTEPVARKRTLLGAAPSTADEGKIVGPLLGATWNQSAPYSDFTPLSGPCGCAATAGGQEHRYWRWPYRFEGSREVNHSIQMANGAWYTHTIRVNGLVPFDWDKIYSSYSGSPSIPNASDKDASYNAAYLTLWMQSLTAQVFKRGSSGATQKLRNYADQFWFERDSAEANYWRDGYTNLWLALKKDLDWGSPIQVNSPVHVMVVDGYAIENEGVEDEIDYINLNYGWGGAEGWVNLKTAVTEGTSGGRLADFQTGYRPQKIVQFEPVPKVSTSDVTLKWHMAPCYTNRTTGFTIEIAKAGGATTSDTINTHEETTTYTATGLDVGGAYTFTVTPIMKEGEGEGRSNIAVTTIGTPQPAPEITSVSSIAGGLEHSYQGIFVECARGSLNKIDLTCSASVTSLKAFSSHLTVLPDNKVTTVNNGNGSWTVNVDATAMDSTWDGDMVLLTLVAANTDGTEAYKNLVLRFNSMRQASSGTLTLVETNPTAPVWFGGTTTLDANGQSVKFGASALNGTGTVTLQNGTFTFEGLDGFTGTLKWAPSVTVNLPADMSNFRGTLWFESYGGSYTLSSCTIGQSANINVAGNTNLNLLNALVNGSISGSGSVVIDGTSSFSKITNFSGKIQLDGSNPVVTLLAGQEKQASIDIYNGTLRLVLDKAKVSYGYDTNHIKNNFGTVVFCDESGNVLAQWKDIWFSSDNVTCSIAATANTWTPDSETGTGNFWDAARWSQGLPNAGDYVIFKDTVGDIEMKINLASDFNLGYVKVIGTSNFQIKAADETDTLSIDTLENGVKTKIFTSKFQPTVVIPNAELWVASSGIVLDCEVDQSIADNIRDSSGISALFWENCWHGTVVFNNYSDSLMPGLDLTFWGNDYSTVRLNGFAGRLTANKRIPFAVELVDSGTTPALHWSTGTDGATSIFDILTGNGIFKTSNSGGASEKVLLKDVSDFTGQFQLAAKTVAIADEMPTENLGNNGRLHVCKAATIAAGSIWNIGGGVYFGSGCDLDVYGQLWSLTQPMTTYGEGATITLEDGAVIRACTAMAGDYSPTLNFKAGKYQFEDAITETKTVNFCADEGKYTTLDANGKSIILGADFFSGSGDVYLTSSSSGGSFTIQGITAAYTGTIYVDSTVALTLPGDLSSMGGKINISEITLARASSGIGNIEVSYSATLQVSLTDDEAMEGLTATGVTLAGGTIEFVDQRGTVISSSTESTVYVKPEDYTVPSPEPTAVWYNDFSATNDGYTLTDWQLTHGENNASVTIDRDNQGLFVDFASAKGYFTVIVKYSNLSTSSSNKRVLFATTANSDYTRNRCGIRLLTDSKVQGLWNNQTSSNNDADYGSASTGTVPSAGTLAFVYDKTSGNGVGGLSAYVAGVDETLPSTALWSNTALKAGDAYGFAVGGNCRDGSASGVEAAKGMTITGLAIFDRVLTSSELKYFRWEDDEPAEEPEVPEITYEVSPEQGAVPAGTKMTVTCDDPTATIYYQKYGETDWTVYIEPVALATGINYYYVKINDGEATLYTYIVAAPEPEPEPEYEGPAPVAVWVAGEFGDDKSAHGGLEFALNGNTTNALGQIVIGNSTTLGATVTVPSGTLPRMTMLVKYSVPAGGAPVAQSVPASLFSTYDMGARAAQSGSSALDGYYLNGNAIAGGYAFSDPAQTMPKEGYVLISNWTTTPNNGDHGTAVYSGETLSELVGGEKTGLRFTGADKSITAIGVGGPTVAGAVPWAGMVIKSVALFDEWVATNVIANYKFPSQGAVQPVDSDRYAIEPVVSWVNDFKTTTKGNYTLSVSGTTEAKDDTFGGVLTIGDAAATIDVSKSANGGNVTVLVKYRAASNNVNAPVVTFGETLSNSVRIDVGAYTTNAYTLAVNRSWNGGNNKWVALNTAATLNDGEGYLLCARKYNDMLVYVGDSLDNMTGGSTAAPGDITFTCDLIQSIGIGGPSGLPNADAAFTNFTGFVVEKVVVFNGYYTPNQIRYVPNPEEADTINIASGATWKFAAGETRTYTNIGTLNDGGTIAITNAATLAEGYYTLATWTTAQKYTTTCAGYGSVGTLLTDGLPEGLSARLIYGAKAIYLRVDNVATQATRKPIVILPYGDSITEGFTAEHMGANYRILLYQKLELLGFKVKSAGIYDKDDGYNSVDPSGKALSDDYKWHSAKHGAVTGRSTSTASGRSDLEENVDTVCAQAGKPDVVLLHIGINDLVSSDRVSKANMSKAVFNSWTNVVWGLVDGLPETKIVVSTVLYGSGGQKTRTIGSEKISLPELIDDFNARVKAYMGTFPEGRVFLADLNDRVKSDDYGIIYKDTIHPDWWGHDQMAEGWLEVITNQFTASQNFSSATPIVAPTDEQLGAAAKDALAEYRKGFELCRRIDITGAGNNVDVSNPYAVEGDGVTEGIEKVGYFVEYVRADNNVNKWVWVDMDAFGTTLDAIGLPSETHQQVVTKLHVKSNHNGIDDVAADDDTVNGFVEFTPFDYNGNVSGVDGAPAGYGSVCDWNDKVVDGNKGCMQVHRVVSTSAAPGGQVLFAYNNWNQSSTVAEFGIGNFSQHFHGGTQTYDYSETKNLSTMNATNYVVKTIEIWTKPYPGIPGTASQEKMTTWNTELDEAGEWAVIKDKPIFFTVPSQTNIFTVALDVDVTGVDSKGTILGFEQAGATSSIEIRARRDDDKYLIGAYNGDAPTGVSNPPKLLSGQHRICVEYSHKGGTFIYLDGVNVYTNSGLVHANWPVTRFAIGGPAKDDNSEDIFTGLKVKNLVFVDGRVSQTSYVAEGESTTENVELTPKQAVIYETKVRGKESEVKSSLKLNGKSGLSSADGARLIDYFDLDNIETNVVFEVESFDLSSALEGGTITPKMNPPLKHGTLWLLGSDDLKTWNDVTSQSENGEFEIDNDYNFFKFEIRD